MVSINHESPTKEICNWTTERVIALAPDTASAKNGKGLATLIKWHNLGKNHQIIWGECQGSGKDPYRTQVDLSEPAFRCSCPSRKFPCKHGLALMLLMVNQPTSLVQVTSPDWVADWIASRAKREEKKTSQPEKTVDLEAQTKRASARLQKVTEGVQELQVWLHDLIRQGITSISTESYNFWEQPAARMIDAQAPGLARQLRDFPSIVSSGSGWQERILQSLGKLHLLLEGFQRLDQLPNGIQADIRTQIGWTQSPAELTELASNHVQDLWLVIGQQVEMEERLRVSRTWLWGKDSDRYALYLQFAHGTQAFEHGFIVGQAFTAKLIFFESAYPLRAIITNREISPLPSSIFDGLGFSTIHGAIASYSKAITQNPWLERFPITLRQLIPIYKDGKWFVRDRNANLLPVSSRFDRSWSILALSGGHPIVLFGEWNGNNIYPLSIWVEDKLYVA